MSILQAGPVGACSLVLALFASACTPSGSGEPAPNEPVAPAEDYGEFLVFDRLSLGQSGDFEAPVEAVYRDAESWSRALDSLTVFEAPAPVDFEQAMVILIAHPQEQGGYSIEVSSIEQLGDRLVVDYEVSVPAGDCIPLVGRALPFQAVRVRRAEGEIEFVRRDVPYECTWRQ